MHLAGPLGLKNDHAYAAGYWKAFEQFFGPQNAPIVKAMLLARNDKVDTGTGELDRVCFGLRQTMSWLAEAIERKAIEAAGKELPRPTPSRPGRGKRTAAT